MSVCHYFLKGTCRFGDRCRFDHPAPARRDVCQYFLRGSCKFGDRCKFEHPGGGSSGFGRDSTSSSFGHRGQSSFGGQNFNSTSSSSSRRWQSGSHFGQNRFDVLSSKANSDNTFGRQQNQQKPSSTRETEHTPSAIQQKIKTDLEAWETSHQWALSCYSFSKGPCISGLIDHSPEELRFTAYNCNAQGNMAAYQQGLAELLGAHKQRRDQLKAMSAVQIADEIKKEGEGGDEDSGFASVFGGSNPQAGSSQGVKMFSSMESTPAGFGGSGFGQSAFNTQQSSGVFGSSNSKPGGSVFGEMTPQEPSSFGSSSAQPMSLFGDQAKSSDSSSMMTEQSGFGTSSQSGTTFGSSRASVASGSGNSEHVTELTKTMAGAAFASAFQLTKEDLAAFKAPAFTLGKIPECPPPLELC